jgi:hypothetical protein
LRFLQNWQSPPTSASGQRGDNPELAGKQGLVAEKLALKYDVCQFPLSSLIRVAQRISSRSKLLPMLPFSTIH